ncbi:unnamed protein product [marine sediment metagenome]|uniref:Uncharacterized protein n=1 Tax=marine sediment metagenome TaxID=412755 RepID=X0VK41_9ZZZZ
MSFPAPKDYLDDWIIEKKRFGNEQYLLEAFLTSNRNYSIKIGNLQLNLKS